MIIKLLSTCKNNVMRLDFFPVLLVAIILRFYGINWDGGALFHPDERAILFHVHDLTLPPFSEILVLLNALESPLNPRWFPYGSFPLYLVKFVESLISVFTEVSFADLRIIGRGISAMADVGTVVMTFILGSKIYSRKVGYLASLLLSLSVINIQLSHYYTVDTYLSFFIVTCIYFMARIVMDGGTKNYLLSGVFIGLSLASKISVLPIFIGLFFAHWCLYKNGKYLLNGNHFLFRHKNLLISLAAASLVFFVTTPYAFLDWNRLEPCHMPVTALNFLSTNEYACWVGGELEMARGESGRPFTQQYIGTMPFFYQIKQLSLFGLGLPLGIVVWISLIFTSFYSISKRKHLDLLILSWVLPYFFLTGYLEVKFLRYMLPITPLMILLASRSICLLQSNMESKWPGQKLTLNFFVGFLILFTAFNAIAYMNIYSKEHNAIRASQWINENIPQGSVILMEHWEEGIPGLSDYVVGCRGLATDSVSCMKMYDHDNTIYMDGKSKIETVATQLSGADYLVFFSNRMYGSIPRLPAKYPYTTQYYRKLFTEELGYELVHVESTYPSFMGIELRDDTFGRPKLAVPQNTLIDRKAFLSIDLGYADESFTAYDHPKILIFRNNAFFDTAQIIQEIFANFPADDNFSELMLSDTLVEMQEKDGTWKQIIYTANMPILMTIILWFALIQMFGVLALPLCLILFRFLPDKGYILAKPFGLLVSSYVVWLFASLQWLSFSSLSMIMSLSLLAFVSVMLVITKKVDLLNFFKKNIRLVFIGESIFFLSFIFFLLVRSANPDLWHPYIGGEKSMEMAHIIAIMKSTYMPPYDPWFSGGYLNYYYFGHFMVAHLIRLTGTLPEIGFNICLSILFAFTTTGVFSLLYNLAESTRQGRANITAKIHPGIAGLIGVFMVVLMGNIDGMVQLLQNLFRFIFTDIPLASFDFWRSSRMIPAGEFTGYAITEFPFFTFLFGDLHSHLISIPFTILTLALLLNLFLNIRNGSSVFSRIPDLVAIGFSIGSLMVINMWDYPTYLIITLLLITIGEFGGITSERRYKFLKIAIQIILVSVVSSLFFKPFLDNYKSFSNGIFFSNWQTPLYSYLAIHSLFLFVVLTFLGISLFQFYQKGKLRNPWPIIRTESNLLAKPVLALSLFFACFTTLAFYGYSTALFLLIILFAFIWFVRQALINWIFDHNLLFILVLIGMALAIGIGVEVITIKGDITRMNTVFKFYLQAWVLLGISSAYLLWLIISYYFTSIHRDNYTLIWFATLSLLILSSAVYPFAGTYSRVNDRFSSMPKSLNGLDYMKNAQYKFDNGHGEESLIWDYHAIQWIRDNVDGSPVILEGQGELYRTLHNRVSIYTGIPTILGWDNHQGQQRGYGYTIWERKNDIETMYSSENIEEVEKLFIKYKVRYIYVGELENYYYKKDGIEKFNNMIGKSLELSYFNPGVKIYRFIN